MVSEGAGCGEQDMQWPKYMTPKQAMEYNIVDGVVRPQSSIIASVKKADQWDKEAGLVAR